MTHPPWVSDPYADGEKPEPDPPGVPADVELPDADRTEREGPVCENPVCGADAYTAVRLTDPNGSEQILSLCRDHRREVWNGPYYEVETVEKYPEVDGR